MSLTIVRIIYIFQLFIELVFSAEPQRDRNSAVLEAFGPSSLTGRFFSQELMLGCAWIPVALMPDQGLAWILSGLLQDQKQAQIPTGLEPDQGSGCDAQQAMLVGPA
jgi:hypothetical protein